MVRQFNAVDEVRKHPGVTAGVVAVLAGVGIAYKLAEALLKEETLEETAVEAILKDATLPKDAMLHAA